MISATTEDPILQHANEVCDWMASFLIPMVLTATSLGMSGVPSTADISGQGPMGALTLASLFPYFDTSQEEKRQNIVDSFLSLSEDEQFAWLEALEKQTIYQQEQEQKKTGQIDTLYPPILINYPLKKALDQQSNSTEETSQPIPQQEQETDQPDTSYPPLLNIDPLALLKDAGFVRQSTADKIFARLATGSSLAGLFGSAFLTLAPSIFNAVNCAAPPVAPFLFAAASLGFGVIETRAAFRCYKDFKAKTHSGFYQEHPEERTKDKEKIVIHSLRSALNFISACALIVAGASLIYGCPLAAAIGFGIAAGCAVALLGIKVYEKIRHYQAAKKGAKDQELQPKISEPISITITSGHSRDDVRRKLEAIKSPIVEDFRKAVTSRSLQSVTKPPTLEESVTKPPTPPHQSPDPTPALALS